MEWEEGRWLLLLLLIVPVLLFMYLCCCSKPKPKPVQRRQPVQPAQPQQKVAPSHPSLTYDRLGRPGMQLSQEECEAFGVPFGSTYDGTPFVPHPDSMSEPVYLGEERLTVAEQGLPEYHPTVQRVNAPQRVYEMGPSQGFVESSYGLDETAAYGYGVDEAATYGVAQPMMQPMMMQPQGMMQQPMMQQTISVNQQPAMLRNAGPASYGM